MVRVQAHDLHRLLLEFRTQIERQTPAANGPTWAHGRDFDRSFERLADVIDDWLAAGGDEPDSRTRCKPGHPAYEWRDKAGSLTWVAVREGGVTGDPGPRLRHLVRESRRNETLCAFHFADEDITQAGGPYRPCRECEREQRLDTARARCEV